MSDALSNGTRFRTFDVIDDFNREVLFIETDYSLKSSRVIWVLRHLIKRYGKPKAIRMDNGPEFVARLTREWSSANDIDFKYMQPGKPTQNAYIERFNKTYREAILDQYLFDNLDEVREETGKFVTGYNHHRRQDAPWIYLVRYIRKSFFCTGLIPLRLRLRLRSIQPVQKKQPTMYKLFYF